MKNYFSEQYLTKGKLTSLFDSVGLRDVIDSRSTNQTMHDGKYYQDFFVLTPFSIARVEISCNIEPRNYAGGYPFTNYFATLQGETILDPTVAPLMATSKPRSNGEQIRYLWEKWRLLHKGKVSLQISQDRGSNPGNPVMGGPRRIIPNQIHVHQTNIVKENVIVRSSLIFNPESQNSIRRTCSHCNTPIPPSEQLDICPNCGEQSSDHS